MAPPVEPATADTLDTGVEVTRHEEQLRVGVARSAYGRVRLRKRIVTEIRTIEVEVRSEVLDIDWLPAEDSERRAVYGAGAQASDPDPLEFVLSGEEPVLTLATVAKERVTATRVIVAGSCNIEGQVRSEQVSVEAGTPPPQ